jgi:hypothetical protein
MRDQVRLIDGPLEGRTFLFPTTPTTPLDFHAAVAPDGRVLAVEGEQAPVNTPFRGVEYRYAPQMATDGHQSRGDDGCLHFYLHDGTD